jgi:ABC transporter with metal-binding/Fe-S-binding domain ATP-binding protein
VAALVTGGKDSALALHRAMQQEHEVIHLVTMVPQRADSWMFHFPNVHLAGLFAEAVGIPLVKADTSGEKETEVADLKQALAQLSIDAVVSGAIFSLYQKERIDGICRDLGVKHVAPLWHEDPLSILKEILELKMRVIIVGVYAHGLTQQWLGREIDENAIKDLIELHREFHVSIVGEGGEYETLVLDAPFFSKRIKLIDTEKVWQGASGYLLVKKAGLVAK